MKTHINPFIIACTSFCVLTVQAYASEDMTSFNINTKGGLSVESEDKAYAFKLGGRIQLDYNNYEGVMNADQGGERGSDIFFRRSRVVLSGKVASDWGFKAEFNIGEDSGGDVTDLYISYKGFGSKSVLTLGNQREPFGLENLTSSKNISTIERSVASNAFDAGRAVGVNLSGYGDNWSYSTGMYERSQDENEDIEFSYTARATFLPVELDSAMVHLGAGLRRSDADIDNISVRPGIRQVDSSDRIISGNIDGKSATQFNVEAAVVFDAVYLSTEYFGQKVDGIGAAEDTDLDAYYLLAGWFITGEKRPYSKRGGSFGKVKPKANSGAWEIVANISQLNLEDNGAGNNGRVVTLGLNWYANSAIRAGINLVRADYDNAISAEDDGNGVSMRLQAVF